MHKIRQNIFLIHVLIKVRNNNTKLKCWKIKISFQPCEEVFDFLYFSFVFFQALIEIDLEDFLLDFMDLWSRQSEAYLGTVSTLGTFCKCLNFYVYPRPSYSVSYKDTYRSIPWTRRRCFGESIAGPPHAAWKKSLTIKQTIIKLNKKNEQLCQKNIALVNHHIRTSTCIQIPWLSQISAISSSGSYAPNTVVPLVALTINGMRFRSFASRIRSSNLWGNIRPKASVATCQTLSVPIPRTEAPLRRL